MSRHLWSNSLYYIAGRPTCFSVPASTAPVDNVSADSRPRPCKAKARQARGQGRQNFVLEVSSRTKTVLEDPILGVDMRSLNEPLQISFIYKTIKIQLSLWDTLLGSQLFSNNIMSSHAIWKISTHIVSDADGGWLGALSKYHLVHLRLHGEKIGAYLHDSMYTSQRGHASKDQIKPCRYT
jgi:hypothetical protein